MIAWTEAEKTVLPWALILIIIVSIVVCVLTAKKDNKILVGNIETLIATLPKETVVGSLVNEKLDEYFEITKEIGDSKGKGMVLELKNKNVPAIIPEDGARARSSKAAFINIAIIIYSVLNIGIILAIAIMK